MTKTKLIFLSICFGVTCVLVILAKLLPVNSKGKPELFEQAQSKADELKKQAEAKMEAAKKEYTELEEIKKIEDVDERMRRLVEYSNRKE